MSENKKRKKVESKKIGVQILYLGLVFMLLGISSAQATRAFEYLDRGVVAVRQNTTNSLITWRSLATDEHDLGFNVYRVTDFDTLKLNETPIINSTNFLDKKVDFTKANSYFVRKVLNDRELDTKGEYTMPANKGIGPYITVPIKAGSKVHFVWVGDLDGDGAYDYVLDRYTEDEQRLEAYSSTGKFLWEINMGPNSFNKNNISPGPSTIDVGMWDGATVYDMDGDGYADLILRVADGVVMGDGQTYRNNIKNGQAIAIIDGRTGALKASAPVPDDYIQIGPLAAMMMIGYLDGKTPSVVCWFKNRNPNKSFNSLMVAYAFEKGQFVQQWKYDNKKGYAEGHQIRVADVDNDGKDEVLHMGYALNGDGTLRYHMDKVVHGDRWYVGAFSKNDKVLMGYGIQQDNPRGLLEYYYNASTGNIFWENSVAPENTFDVGRGNVGDIDPNYEGFEVWSFQGTYNAPSGKKIADNYMYPVLRYWWDGDLGAESYNDGKIEKWDYKNKSVNRVNTTWNVYESSGSDRGVAMFHGDIIGDWREESILVNYTKNELVIFTTDIETEHRIYSLAQNPCYRNGMTAKGYIQASMLDYFLGWGMEAPPKPDIEIIGGLREADFASIIDEPTTDKEGSTESFAKKNPINVPNTQHPQWNLVRNRNSIMLQNESSTDQKPVLLNLKGRFQENK